MESLQVNTGAIDIHDPELKQQLALSSADLRFTDYLLQHLANYAALEDEQNVGKYCLCNPSTHPSIHPPTHPSIHPSIHPHLH